MHLQTKPSRLHPLRDLRTIAVMALFLWILLSLVSPAWADFQLDEDLSLTLSEKRLMAINEALDRWQFAEAFTLAQGIEQDGEDDAGTLFTLARVFFHQGRYVEGLDALNGMAGEDLAFYRKVFPLETYLKNAFEVTKDFQKRKSAHFEIRYQPGKDEILLDYAEETLEAALAAFEKDFQIDIPQTVGVEIAPTLRDLSLLTGVDLASLKKSGVIAICKFNKLMVVSPRALPLGYSWRDTLSHELAHLFISTVSKNTVPIWLHEGLAKYEEVRWRTPTGNTLSASSETLLATALEQGKVLPLEKLHPSIAYLPSQDAASLAFAQVMTIIQWLQRLHGYEGLRKLLHTLRDLDGAMDASLSKVYGMNLARLEAKWINDLKRRRLQTYAGVFDDRKIIFDESDEDSDEKVLESLPKKQARRLTTLGKLLKDRGHQKAALKEFEKARAEIGDINVRLQNYLAEQYLALQEFQKAERSLDRVSTLYPGYGPTFIRLARARMGLKNYAQALNALKQALALNIFDPRVHALMAEAYEQQGNADEARKAHQRLNILMGDR